MDVESLFSLEVIVNFVKLNHNRQLVDEADPKSRLRARCLFPTVAFRLLDYPTIAINLLDDFDADELRRRLNIQESFSNIEKLPCFTELLDKDGRYVFSKGKSCLFRCDLESLRVHLNHAPMYLMVLDTFFQPYKLVGTTLVPLSDLINQIYQETSEQLENGSKKTTPLTPCMRMSFGVFEVKNLMGDEIGHVSFACRLTCFGSSLLPHLQEVMSVVPSSSRKQSSSSSPTRQSFQIDTDKTRPRSREKSTGKDTPEADVSAYELKKSSGARRSSSPTKQKSSAFIQTIEIEHQDAQVQIDAAAVGRADKQTQSPESKRKQSLKINPSKVYTVKHVQDEFVFNHFCPPPLVYNSENDKISQAGFQVTKTTGELVLTNNGENCSQTTTTFQSYKTTTVNKKIFINKRVEYLSEALKSERDPTEGDQQLEAKSAEESEEENQYEFIMPVSAQSRQGLGQFNFEDMPLLKCLFEEMSKLKNMMEMGPVATKSINLINQNNKKQKRPIKSKTPLINVKQRLINEHRKKSSERKEAAPAVESARAESAGQHQHRPTRPQNRKSILKLNKQPFKSREELLESVNRLAQPKGQNLTPRNIRGSLVHQNDSVSHDETPVGQNAPKVRIPSPRLKYGLTNAHRMRVLASQKKKYGESLDAKHEELMEKVKSNLDNLSINSSGMNVTTTPGNSTGINETGQRNLDKVMFFDSINSTSTGGVLRMTNNQAGFNNSATLRSQPTMNYSLLNKVDLESTVFETQNRYSNDFSDATSSNTSPTHDQKPGTPRLQEPSQPVAKFVQFGDTYVMNTSSNGLPSDEATSLASEMNSANRASQISMPMPKTIQVAPRKQERTKNIDYSSTSYRDSNELRSSGSAPEVQNIFLKNKSQDAYENDFNSSLETTSLSSKQSTSTTTTSNFFTRFDPKRPGSQQSRQSPSQRLTSSQKFKQNIKEEMEDELEEQDSASFKHRSRRLPSDNNDNYGSINRSSNDLRSSSKYSSVDSYSNGNIKSLVDDSLAMSKDSSSRSIRSRSGKNI